MPPTERRWCTCDVLCKGGRFVSRSVWFDHARYRHQVPELPGTTAIAIASGSGSHSQKRQQPDPEGNGGGRNKHPRRDDLEQGCIQSTEATPPPSPPEQRVRPLSPLMPHDPGLAATQPTLPEPPPASAAPLPAPLPVQPRQQEVHITPDFVPRTEDLKVALSFQRRIAAVTLDNSDLAGDQIECLRNPVTEVVTINDNDVLLSVKLFVSTLNASNQVYEDVRRSVMEVHPEDTLLSLASVKKMIANLTGVVPVMHDMCPNTCLAYTGDFADLENCPTCGESRYDPIRLAATQGAVKVPRQHFYTMPLGPQLQALWQTPEGAKNMEYRDQRTQGILEELDENNGRIPVYEDIYHGQEYLEAVARGDISPNDVVLMFSMDGAQLYDDKDSDCWIYMWVIFNLSPDLRYKKKYILPGGIIPGPNNPKNTDSFLFPGFHHLSALMKEGFRVWNASSNRTFTSHPYLYLGSADGPGSVHFTGFVGHHGAYPCRLYCGIKGWHKEGLPHYYPALLKPNEYDVPGSSHPDVNPASVAGCSPRLYATNLKHLLQSCNPTDFKQHWKDTGITTLSLFSGLPAHKRLPVPSGFPGDSMHAPTLNLVLHGDVWKKHGEEVADCKPYIPGLYDRPPRNLADKISSRYKAKEWQGYFYGLAPALLYDVLPKKYWKNFCKLVYAVRLLHQHRITHENVKEAHICLQQFHHEFEVLYYQRCADRLHFVCPVLHAILHMPTETVRVGPGPLYSTWTMEHMIGDLGREIHQPSNPYANLSERGLLRCQINTLKATFPGLEAPNNDIPRYSEVLGDGYVFLCARDEYPQILTDAYRRVIKAYIEDQEMRAGNEIPATWHGPRVARWARLHLPNGQIARSAWKEDRSLAQNIRRARYVKTEFAEVKFYFHARINEDRRPLALVSLLSRPDKHLFDESFSTVWSVTEQDDDGLCVVDAKSITAVVAVIPHKYHIEQDKSDSRFFVWEYLGLEMDILSNALDSDILENEDLDDE
ncbi:hypothetical protein NLJ89_g9101 [Agrocybe chaxingu]|uniref:Transposase family Tnp2 protein n=1 Tax=Agrocybe chaxingu TaxID=84603 RepID=A0A9W8MRJ4_9AGAR|nr:hypothetical protein NLJ89_g9101 [Agrocybe chaxingu]